MKSIQDKLRCPVCKSGLQEKEDKFVCSSCSKNFRIKKGIPIFLPELDNFKITEQKFHNLLSKQKPTQGIKDRNFYFHWHFRAPMLNLAKDSLVLELACGVRADGLELAQKGICVIESDISFNSLLKARELARLEHVENNTYFMVSDAENLPLTDGSLDACFIAASFHHLPNQKKALLEMKRCVRPGGFIILGVEPNSWPYYTIFPVLKPLKWLIRKKRKREYDSVADDTTFGFSRRSLNKLFAQAGLEILEIMPVKFLSEYYESGMRLIQRLFPKKKISASKKFTQFLLGIDRALAYVPIVNLFPWHWNVIAKVGK